MSTIMEGLRRANELPPTCWTFWQRRVRSFLLVPISLLPLVLVSLIVVFGHLVTTWIVLHSMPSARTTVYLLASLIRWIVALTGSVGLIATIYHLGSPLPLSWRRNLPGAVAATAMWLASTLVFGWYVTRFANYSQVYGSLGAGIALLFWLYLVSFSVLCGAEFNALFCAHYFPPVQSATTADSPPDNPLPS
jgi:membrane protein